MRSSQTDAGMIMSDDPAAPHRRWEDIQHEIVIQVAQAMTAFRLTLDRLDRSTEELRATVYGRPDLRMPGIIDRLEQFEGRIKAIDSKLDTLLDESRDRTNQIL